MSKKPIFADRRFRGDDDRFLPGGQNLNELREAIKNGKGNQQVISGRTFYSPGVKKHEKVGMSAAKAKRVNDLKKQAHDIGYNFDVYDVNW